MSMTPTLGPFPVDDATLLAVEEALDACLSKTGEDENGQPIFTNVGSAYSLPDLLEFLSGYDKHLEVPMLNEYDQPIPDFVEYVGGPVYHPNDVILALIHEVRRLRAGVL